MQSLEGILGIFMTATEKSRKVRDGRYLLNFINSRNFVVLPEDGWESLTMTRLLMVS